ncbi:MAG: TIGR02444 family protein [Halieaceae bacterium]|jgi:uncharacterized protein (TIGR02444 family)|nr:TIGR02444 family protein [Halieaceae bacterium]
MMHRNPSSAPAPLWDFAVAVYQGAGVSAACLEAQDRHGFDVNLLLFAAWLAGRGEVLDEARLALAEARCRAWREELLQPLRRQRRRWKKDAPHPQAYEALKSLELEAERRQLEFLGTLAAEASFSGAAPGRAASAAEASPFGAGPGDARRARLAAGLEVLRLAAGAPEGALDGFAVAVEAAMDELLGGEESA